MTVQVHPAQGQGQGNERKGIDLSLLVSQAISKDDASHVYRLAPELSRIPPGEYAEYRGQLKAHFKQRLALSTLDNLVRQARKGRKLAELAVQRAKQKEHPGERMRVETGGQLRDVVEASLEALVQANKDAPTLFVRGSELVTIHYTKDGQPTVTPLTEHSLRLKMSHSADYVTVHATFDDVQLVPVDPPLDVVRAILEGMSPGDWPFPELEAITELPILRPDGTICERPGYDPLTKQMYIPGNLAVPPIPELPTKADVARARELIEYLFADFPFSDQSSRATIIADLITVVIRSVIDGQVPLTLLDAPKQGTGKSLLALIIGIIATGRIVPTNAPTNDEEEWRKKILTWLLPSPSVVIIDNLIHPLESSSLNSALTSPYVEDRNLGTQALVKAPNRAVWFATGNNIRVGDDTARRCITCRLDALIEKPWKRAGFREDNILAWALSHRGEIVAAILTLARYWYTQGCPKPDVTPLGNFENWTITVGGILQSVSIPDFLTNLEKEDGESSIDEISLEWGAFIQAVYATFSDTPFILSELARRMREEDTLAEDLRETLPASLTKSFDQFQRSEGRDRDFATHLGHAFRIRKGQVWGEFRLELAGKAHANKVQWKVISRAQKPPVAPEQEPAPSQNTLLAIPVSDERPVPEQEPGKPASQELTYASFQQLVLSTPKLRDREKWYITGYPGHRADRVPRQEYLNIVRGAFSSDDKQVREWALTEFRKLQAE